MEDVAKYAAYWETMQFGKRNRRSRLYFPNEPGYVDPTTNLAAAEGLMLNNNNNN